MMYKTITAGEGVTDIYEAADAAYNNIRNDQTTTADEKRKRIARAYLSALDAVNGLKDGAQSATADRIQNLSRKLFGIPTSATSSDIANYRDATDRANKIERTSDAIAQLNQATLIGDTSMARAILGAAFAQGWADVVNAYTALNPTLENDIEELWDANQHVASANPLVTAWAYIVPTPPELARLSPYAIREIAAGGDRTNQVLS